MPRFKIFDEDLGKERSMTCDEIEEVKEQQEHIDDEMRELFPGSPNRPRIKSMRSL